ncbi:gliding motility-associated C-terminal domain-containing protein [Fulvivirga sp. M361]|uniref:T9SS type B sorting domain-containing protein n=1 Tax=Fulvivirga sp. M361 TaxID=2594266 RepID=UPI00117ACF2E|nr:gliding motility-associated C-terminal domain-containing protein [Fulvivirga sp. M361]TRX61791.1 gliding motility-associated C-terminal domain-containing protein [Fulvivirga sp. M361]
MKRKFFLHSIRFLIIGLVTIISSCYQQLYATHLRAGEIIVRRDNCSANIFTITIIVYTDTGSDVRFGEGILDFGDGSDTFTVPVINNGNAVTWPDVQNPASIDIDGLGNEVSAASFTIDHVYSSAAPFYVITYTEPNRNEGVVNIDNSVNTTFHLETQISLDASLGCNNSPVLLIPPIDRACAGVAFFHNPGAFDPDGDSLSFELVIPKKDAGTLVDGYEPLNDPSFYENFGQGNETRNGPPTFSIDPDIGEIEWNAPGRLGEYNIAFIVKEYRFRFGEWFQLGFVRRDMQIIVEGDCRNERPELRIPEDICVEAGTLIDERILGFDPDGDSVVIEAFSQIMEEGAVVVGDGVIQSSVPQAEVNFRWQTECEDIREQPYQVVFKITDQPADNGIKLVSFATWNITVVGPAPTWNDPDAVVQEGQSLRLSWEDYECRGVATNLQVWRRVDSNPYIPDECETGIRENAGYELISSLPDNQDTFLDENLASAAKYCYRLIAVFPDPPGGESIISEERCFEFVPAEEPIITHISVRSTSESNGEVSITWREPFELGGLIPPYTFRVYRSTGFNGTGDEALVSTDIVRDITETDSTNLTFVDTGLNTLNEVYHYRVAIVDPTGGSGGDEIFSAPASTVRLELTPQFGQIQLNWRAEVPWSNTIATAPGSQHLIYRGLEGDTDDELDFLAAVDVTEFGFEFIDSMNLSDDQIYCYRVLTKGTYGNPAIQGPSLDPLVNFSQMACAQPSDSIPPCAPELALTLPDCEVFTSTNTCSFNDFRNELSWTTDFDDDACQNDIRNYEVHYAPTTESEFTVVAEVTNERFDHENLPSFKGCYKILAIDRSGNPSEFSNTICVDNCPNYELPNVFTPNGDKCNEVFSAYSDTNFTGEDGQVTGECGVVEAFRCARFVLAVDFTVYNRWGKPVYTYQGDRGSENSILINWDGRGDNGSELSAGVYYYLAQVTFDTVDPGNAVRDIKGWVQIIR